MNIHADKITWLAELAAKHQARVFIDVKPGHTRLRSTCVRKNGQTTVRIFTDHKCWQTLKREIERVGYHSDQLILVSELLEETPCSQP